MIEIDITGYEEEAVEYINMLTEDKRKKLRKEMINFLKQNTWPDSIEYGIVLEFINDFFVER